MEQNPLLLRPLIGLLYQARMLLLMMIVEQLSEWMIARRDRSSRRKPAPVPFCITNPTWIEMGSNPGLQDGKPATNLLSYGTANLMVLYHYKQ
jgi:hypothetical protein